MNCFVRATHDWSFSLPPVTTQSAVRFLLGCPWDRGPMSCWTMRSIIHHSPKTTLASYQQTMQPKLPRAVPGGGEKREGACTPSQSMRWKGMKHEGGGEMDSSPFLQYDIQSVTVESWPPAVYRRVYCPTFCYYVIARNAAKLSWHCYTNSLEIGYNSTVGRKNQK